MIIYLFSYLLFAVLFGISSLYVLITYGLRDSLPASLIHNTAGLASIATDFALIIVMICVA